jgi:hypothetical protein
MQGMYWLTVELFASQEGLWAVKSVSQFTLVCTSRCEFIQWEQITHRSFFTTHSSYSSLNGTSFCLNTGYHHVLPIKNILRQNIIVCTNIVSRVKNEVSFFAKNFQIKTPGFQKIHSVNYPKLYKIFLQFWLKTRPVLLLRSCMLGIFFTFYRLGSSIFHVKLICSRN